MERLIISNFEDFESRIGTVLGYSEYFTINQDQVNKFAGATLDHQWIHTDPERAMAPPKGLSAAARSGSV